MQGYKTPPNWVPDRDRDNFGQLVREDCETIRRNSGLITINNSQLASPNYWYLIFTDSPDVKGVYKFILTVNIETRTLTNIIEVEF